MVSVASFITVSILLLVVFNSANPNPIMSVGNFKLTKLQMCDPKINYPISYEFEINKGDDGVHLFNAKAHLKVNYGENADFNLTISMKKSNEEEFSPVISIYKEDACEAIKTYLGSFAEKLHKAAGIEPGVCPVPKGEYEVKDIKFDLSHVNVQMIPEAYIHLKYTMTDLKTKEVLVCMIGEGENFPN